MPTMTKLRTYVRNTGTSGRNASQSVPCGTLSSRTMIVIRIAITPSLNPSRRPFVMRRVQLLAPRRLAASEHLLAGGLEQLDRNAVGIVQLDLFSAQAYFHLISKVQSFLSELGNTGRQVPHLQDNPIPSAWLLSATVGHQPRPRSTGTAEGPPSPVVTECRCSHRN